MSIVAYVGLPRSGKSYGVVQNVVIPALKQGRVVVHNLPLKPKALSIVCDRDVEPLLVQIPKGATAQDVVRICLDYPGAVRIFDEVWRYWRSGIKSNEVPEDQMSLFKEHGHSVGKDGRACEMVIVDQELGSGVARFIRDLVEFTYVHTKGSKLGLKTHFRVDIYSSAQNRTNPKQSDLLRQLVGKYSPEVWNCYTSHTQNASDLGEAGLEEMPDKRATIWKHPMVIAGLACGVLLVPVAIGAVTGVANFGEDEAKKMKHVAGSERDRGAPRPGVVAYSSAGALPSVNASGGVAAPVAPLEPGASAVWKLRGFVRGGSRDVAVIESARGSRRIDAKDCSSDGVEWSCKFAGEIVASWTGRPDTAVNLRDAISFTPSSGVAPYSASH